MKSTILNYLEETGAVGKSNAATTGEIIAALHITSAREVKRTVAMERKAGRLICSSYSGGYYLPANQAEILEMKNRLEKGFISRADAVRVFRHAMKEIEKGKAGGADGKEETART